ncbi:MAG TPA: Qat anti-phage system TatD family nuclease QatD [Xanthobacteraceae bacterium]|nr:Qat anti-phage system TatD family nuclease QatD [Xanthobacteraceae bacterium]
MIDFHCHLDLYPNPERVVRECIFRDAYVLSVTTTPSAWHGTSALVAGAPRIRVALGLHPELARERKHELPLFEELLPQTRYVGEIGLDGAPATEAFWNDQVCVFDGILAACERAGGKIMTIHSRRAATKVLDRLESHPKAGIAILHWFSGSRVELKRAIDLDCWFSVGPAMLRGAKGKELVKLVPRDRLLTETDGPFALVDGRPAKPWDVDEAILVLAELWRCGRSEIESELHSNLKRLIVQYDAF